MKKPLILTGILCLFLSNQFIKAQNCSVSISGGSCTGTELNAVVNGRAIAKLTWYWDGFYISGADTISSPSSVSLVAGGNGTGGALNQLGFPAGGISVDEAGNVYVADAVNSRVVKWAPGATSGVIVAGGHGKGNAANQLSTPRDVFVDKNGNIYIADNANYRIQKWAPGAITGTTVAGGNGPGSADNQISGCRGVYVDADGNIYIADTYNYRIQKWKAGAKKGTTVAGGNGPGLAANQFSYPVDVYLDAAKNVYVADAFTESADHHRVQKWAPGATSGVTVAGDNGTGSAANQFGYLLAIYVDSAGNVYATDNGIDGAPVSRVQKWAAGATSGVTVAGGHTGGWDVLSYPTGVAVDKKGLIYVFNGVYNPAVKKYIPTNGITDPGYTPSRAGKYNAQAVLKNGCIATSNNLIIRAVPEVYNIYAMQKKGRGNLCDGGTDTFYVNQWDSVTNYTWKIPPQCSLVANLNDSVVINVPAGFNSGNLLVSGVNNCGVSNTDTARLLGRPISPAGIKGAKKVFANQTNLVYTVADENVDHNWIVPAGVTIVSGQGTNTIHVNWGTLPGSISVNSYNDCGESKERKEIEVTVRNSFAANDARQAGSLSFKNKATVFPNPARDIVIIEFNSGKQANYFMEVKDVNGRIVTRKEIVANQGINNVKLDVSNYVNGTYLISIKNSETAISLKLNRQD